MAKKEINWNMSVRFLCTYFLLMHAFFLTFCSIYSIRFGSIWRHGALKLQHKIKDIFSSQDRKSKASLKLISSNSTIHIEYYWVIEYIVFKRYHLRFCTSNEYQTLMCSMKIHSHQTRFAQLFRHAVNPLLATSLSMTPWPLIGGVTRKSY